MPFLQFFSGARDQDLIELSPSGGTVIGNNPEAQVQCDDAGVMANHCQVYQGDGKWWLRDGGSGSTVMKMRRIGPNNPPEIVPLAPGEVFIIGQTYLKFWLERPAGESGGGADPAALEAAQAEATQAREAAEALQTELDTLKASGSDAAGALEAAQGELATTQGELEGVKSELEGVKSELATSQSELESTKEELQGIQTAYESAQTSHEAAMEEARAAAEQAASEAKEAAQAERADLDSALAASRGALEGLQAEIAAEPSDPLAAAAESDLQAILDSLNLDDDLRRRLGVAIAAEADREALRRVAGPVVPLRGLRVPGLDVDLERAIQRIQTRNDQLASVRDLGLDGLEESELERLLELARS